jgi:hypothetical protein
MSGLPPNLLLRNASVPSIGRVYSQDSRPRANMFFARSFSLRVSSANGASASTVIEVSPTACTW